MSRDDEAGAIAAATYFLTKLYPYTVSSNNTPAWLAMSNKECNFCRSAVVTSEDLASRNHLVVYAPFRAMNVIAEERSPVAFGVFFDLETGPDTTYDSEGMAISTNPITSGRASIAIVRQGLGWQVLGVQLDLALDK